MKKLLFLSMALAFSAITTQSFAQSDFQDVNKSFLKTHFSKTYSDQYINSNEFKTAYERFYDDLVVGLSMVRRNETRAQRMWHYGKDIENRNYIEGEFVEDEAMNHIQKEIGRGFLYSTRKSLPIISKVERGISRSFDIFGISSEEPSEKDNIRYDLVANDITPAQSTYMLAAIYSDDYEILQNIEKDHVEWGIEPVQINRLPNHSDQTFWNSIPTNLETSVRLITPTIERNASIRFAVNDSNDYYRFSLDTAADNYGHHLYHTFSLPLKKSSIHSVFDGEFNLYKISAGNIYKFNNASTMNLNYYTAEGDFAAEFIIPTKNIFMSLSAIYSKD